MDGGHDRRLAGYQGAGLQPGQRVLEAALRGDREGLDQLTIRRLGEELGIESMSSTPRAALL
jgi:hypothetical protein